MAKRAGATLNPILRFRVTRLTSNDDKGKQGITELPIKRSKTLNTKSTSNWSSTPDGYNILLAGPPRMLYVVPEKARDVTLSDELAQQIFGMDQRRWFPYGLKLAVAKLQAKALTEGNVSPNFSWFVTRSFIGGSGSDPIEGNELFSTAELPIGSP